MKQYKITFFHSNHSSVREAEELLIKEAFLSYMTRDNSPEGFHSDMFASNKNNFMGIIVDDSNIEKLIYTVVSGEIS